MELEITRVIVSTHGTRFIFSECPLSCFRVIPKTFLKSNKTLWLKSCYDLEEALELLKFYIIPEIVKIKVSALEVEYSDAILVRRGNKRTKWHYYDLTKKQKNFRNFTEKMEYYKNT